MSEPKGKDAYILEVCRDHIRKYVDKKARYKEDGILYYLKKDKRFVRKFLTLKKARRLFYDLYPS